jgi:hypothetical protein
MWSFSLLIFKMALQKHAQSDLLVWVSGGNQPLRANNENFNLIHMMLIQGKTYGRWEG